MSVLALRLAGPLQSWGSRSRFSDRDTEMEPTRSGVIGLLCAALGLPRDSSLERFEGLRMAGRGDRQGALLRDFHTAQNVRRAGGGKTGEQAVISNRYYLTDAVFLVLLEGDHDLLAELDDALANPVWPLFLGRKSCPPSEPVRIPNGILEVALDNALLTVASLDAGRDRFSGPLRCIVESTNGEEIRRDVPISFALGNRQYASRRVATIWIELTSPEGEASE